MIEKFIALILTNVTADVLDRVINAVTYEWAKAQLKKDRGTAVDNFKLVRAEIHLEELTDEEKNKKLITAGDVVIKLMRKQVD